MTQRDLFEDQPLPILYWRTMCVELIVRGGCGYYGRRKRECFKCPKCAGKVVAIPITAASFRPL